MHRPTDNLRIVRIRPLISPAILHEELPITDEIAELVSTTRAAISDILHGRDGRQIAVVGPCSIHDPVAALEYAGELKKIAETVQDRVLVVMRAYFEKPRTTVGWKGYINDPDLDGSYEINKGLRLTRKLLLDLNAMGMPTASEFLDLQIPQHITDVTSWVAIGARTTESQVHRELASGLSMPVGFKNTTEGNIGPAVDAVFAAQSSHWFPGVTDQSVGAIFHTAGNSDCHVVLRGGSRTGPNFGAASVHEAVTLLTKKGLPARVMIDCSHGNSDKDYRRQGEVLANVVEQLRADPSGILGVMIESNLVEGRQDVVPGQPLTYGQSITDGCISLAETRRLLESLASCAS